MEEYKKCFNNYEISNFGNVREITPAGYKNVEYSYSKNGTKFFHYEHNNKKFKTYVALSVMRTFKGQQGTDGIKYKDGNRDNCRLDNLEYAPQEEIIKICSRDYKKNNKEEINAKQRQRVNCPNCKKELCKSYLSKHRKTCDKYDYSKSE